MNIINDYIDAATHPLLLETLKQLRETRSSIIIMWETERTPISNSRWMTNLNEVKIHSRYAKAYTLEVFQNRIHAYIEPNFNKYDSNIGIFEFENYKKFELSLDGAQQAASYLENMIPLR